MYSKLFLIAIGLFHILFQYNYGTWHSSQSQVAEKLGLTRIISLGHLHQ